MSFLRTFRRILWRFSLPSTNRINFYQKLLLSLVALCCVTLLYIAYQLANGRTFGPTKPLPVVTYCCSRNVSNIYDLTNEKTHIEYANIPKVLKTDRRILLLVETQYSPLGKDIVDVLNVLKFPYRKEVLGKNLPLLTTTTKGRFSLVIIENYYKYLNMDDWNRQLLDKYCVDYGVGIMGFLLSRPDLEYKKAQVRGFPLQLVQKQRVADLELNETSKVHYIAKSGQTLAGTQPGDDWLLFYPFHQTFETVLLATRMSIEDVPIEDEKQAVVIVDKGDFDGVRRMLFGYNLKSWLVKLTFVDGLRFISEGQFSVPLKRYVQIDIDDIFVGPMGHRMVADDVKALIEGQERFRERIPGFTFNLGFSGKYYRAGSYVEDWGDDALIENAQIFNWFPHMWKHQQPHKTNNDSILEALLMENKLFSKTYNLPVRWPYAVAPHHSGVYPVHEPLFDAWKNVWGIRVTSTEEYPHLKPSSLRRGFVHRGILVLPRQTCGLYTHTIFMDSYPGGANRLNEMILGGELFFSFVLNPFLIFMTHSTNFANDRLALYTFETAFRFVDCWTNLKLKYVNPLKLAKLYFEHYPEEREPVWGNPCLDPRHMDIWSPEKNCLQLPRALILGPQKTGSTALYTFLKLHPGLLSNKESTKTFEEVQFFGGRNYANGLDWYMSFFELPNNDYGINSTKRPVEPYFFEKSATYFDSESAPRQVRTLLPDVKLIVLLISPAKRAYSWYQHMRAKGDETAMRYTFEQIITATEDVPRELFKLRQHCLLPGKYVHFLEKWLDLFPSKHMLIVDGEELKTAPADVMTNVQQFLGLDPEIDFSQLLEFDPNKGFYCQLNKSKRKCLGKSKGRRYPPMKESLRQDLLRFYRPHNIALHRLLTKLAYKTPQWLQEELAGEL